jgi:hypothetical protein
MTRIFKEIDFFGIYLSPFFGCLVVAGCAFLIINRWLDHIELQRYVWNRPLFDAALFFVLLSITVFLL